jgi:Fis family transcriptional regulator
MNSLSAQHSSVTLDTFYVQRVDRSEPLRECVRNAVRFYLHHMADHAAVDLHQMVLREIERPMIEEVLDFTQGNQSRASAMLGLSRTTLRKKLAHYQLGADA